MSMSAGSSGPAPKAEPNVTPMIDVMLVLLIIFMIVVPAINAGFNAVPPEAQSVKTHPEEETDQVLGIDSDGKYYLNKKPIQEDQLAAQVNAIFTGKEEHIMYVKAHRDIKYAKVIDALDILAHNGVAVAALITEAMPGKESLVESDRIKPANK